MLELDEFWDLVEGSDLLIIFIIFNYLDLDVILKVVE